MYKFLIIQTAFTGDVVLATSIIEKVHQQYPEAQIDFMLRKGNEGLLKGHPYIKNLYVWDKKQNKTKNLIRLALEIKRQRYSHVINPHRFAASGFVTFMSGAPYKAGYDKNPFAFTYTKKVKHIIADKTASTYPTEISRYQELLEDLTEGSYCQPKLYPSAQDYDSVRLYQDCDYICIAPASVWFTKQFPAERWGKLIDLIPNKYTIYIIGGPGDVALADEVLKHSNTKRANNLAGKLNYLQSAALIQGAAMTYSNDSAPLHFATATNAPVTAVFCSTIPQFGFGPTHAKGHVVEIQENLDCRPCGLHGRKSCPLGHFNCAQQIKNEQLLWWI